MKKVFYILAIILTGLITSTIAQEKPIFANEEGAIKGYDAVAYFKENKAIKGESKFMYEWKGANWHFSNPQNLKEFKANPDKYAPQYGGYCAFGYAKGHASPTEPEVFKIVDGKLYLNYNAQVQQMWNKDIPNFIIDADKNYKADQMKIESATNDMKHRK